MKVIKRDGRTIDFDRQKIEIAIEKANREVRGKEKATKDEINQIITYMKQKKKAFCPGRLIQNVKHGVICTVPNIPPNICGA